MKEVHVALPSELLDAAGVNPADPSRDAAMLLALELYRERKVSLGRAAELCQVPVEQFMTFAGRHEVPIDYQITDIEADRRTLDHLGL